MSAIKTGDDKFLMLETSKIKFKTARMEDDEKFEELKNSIKEFGLIEPIIVTPTEGNGKYDVIAGNRRSRACKEVGLKEVPVIVKARLDAIEKDILTLVENVQRKDLIDKEKRDGLIAIYERIGFSPDQANIQLNKIEAAEDKRTGLSRSNLDAYKRHGVNEIFLRYSKLTGFTATTQKAILLLLNMDPEILDAAEESGLTLTKKRLIVSTKLIRKNKGEKKVHKRVQREALRQIKRAENLPDARAKVNQLAQDVQTGAFDPETAEYHDYLHDKIMKRPLTEDNMTFLIYGINNGARRIIDHITGLNTYGESVLESSIKEKEILKRERHMIDISKKLTDRDIARLQSHLIPLKATIDKFTEILFTEAAARKEAFSK